MDYLLKLLVFSILSEFYFQVPDSAHMELVQVCLHSTAAETFVSLIEPIWTNAIMYPYYRIVCLISDR